jgi:hypothetical protein
MHLKVHEAVWGAVHVHYDPYVPHVWHTVIQAHSHTIQTAGSQTYTHTGIQTYSFYPTFLQFDWLYTHLICGL